MKIRREVLPFLGISLIAGCVVGLLVSDSRTACVMTVIVSSFVIYFFRDPERCPPLDESAIVSGADGRVMSVSFHTDNEHLNTRSIKISVFLSLFDVHVNRAPLLGQAEFRGYFPGKKMFAFLDKSSEVNQHNKILIVGTRTRCLVVQLAVYKQPEEAPAHDLVPEAPSARRARARARPAPPRRRPRRGRARQAC